MELPHFLEAEKALLRRRGSSPEASVNASYCGSCSFCSLFPVAVRKRCPFDQRFSADAGSELKRPYKLSQTLDPSGSQTAALQGLGSSMVFPITFHFRTFM